MLNLIKFGCKTKISDTENDKLIRTLIRLMRDSCSSQPCDVKNQNSIRFHPKCTICKDVIRDIKHKIENSALEEDIKYRLESLCDPLPNKDKCVDFVETYTKKLLNTLIDDIKEESVCAEIGYC